MNNRAIPILLGAAFSFAASGFAFAADIPVKAPPAPPPVPVFSWTGFYVGGDVGGKWLQDKWTVTSLFDGGGPAPGFVGVPGASTVNYTVSGIRAGGFIGFNWQFSPTWVGGVEGDAAWADSTVTRGGFPGCEASASPGFTCVAGASVTPNGLPFGGDTTSVKMLWDASARVRLGYLVGPDSLFYATGGAAWQHIEVFGQCGSPVASSAFCFTLTGSPGFPGITQSTTLVGWTVGGGFEHHLWGNWLVRAEYRFSDFGSWSTNFPFPPPAPGLGNNTYRFSNSVITNIFKFGVGYKF